MKQKKYSRYYASIRERGPVIAFGSFSSSTSAQRHTHTHSQSDVLGESLESQATSLLHRQSHPPCLPLSFYVAHKKSKYYATLRFTIVFSLVSKQHGLLMLDCMVCGDWVRKPPLDSSAWHQVAGSGSPCQQRCMNTPPGLDFSFLLLRKEKGLQFCGASFWSQFISSVAQRGGLLLCQQPSQQRILY